MLIYVAFIFLYGCVPVYMMVRVVHVFSCLVLFAPYFRLAWDPHASTVVWVHVSPGMGWVNTAWPTLSSSVCMHIHVRTCLRTFPKSPVSPSVFRSACLTVCMFLCQNMSVCMYGYFPVYLSVLMYVIWSDSPPIGLYCMYVCLYVCLF